MDPFDLTIQWFKVTLSKNRVLSDALSFNIAAHQAWPFPGKAPANAKDSNVQRTTLRRRMLA